MKNFKQYEIKKIPISNLKPYERNARTHSTAQIAQIMNSIREFGFTNPLLIDSEGGLIAGHGRLEALNELNRVDFKDAPITEVPCVVIDGLSEPQKRALILADNKLALNAGWDEDILSEELNFLQDVNFDFEITGFNNDGILNLTENFNVDEFFTENTEPPKEKPKTICPNCGAEF